MKWPWPDVRFGSKADMCSAKADVRFTPNSGHVRCTGDVRFVPIADIAMLVDHLIEARTQDWWNPQPKRPRCSITLKGHWAVRHRQGHRRRDRRRRSGRSAQ